LALGPDGSYHNYVNFAALGEIAFACTTFPEAKIPLKVVHLLRSIRTIAVKSGSAEDRAVRIASDGLSMITITMMTRTMTMMMTTMMMMIMEMMMTMTMMTMVLMDQALWAMLVRVGGRATMTTMTKTMAVVSTMLTIFFTMTMVLLTTATAKRMLMTTLGMMTVMITFISVR
jgi:hypothetical protein